MVLSDGTVKDLFPLTYTVNTASANRGDNAYATIQIPVKGIKTLRVTASGSIALNTCYYRDADSSSNNAFPSTDFTIDVSDMEKLFINFGTIYSSGHVAVSLTLSVVS